MSSSADGRLRLAIVESDDDLIQLFAAIFADAGFVVMVVPSPNCLSANWRGDVVLTDSGSFPMSVTR